MTYTSTYLGGTNCVVENELSHQVRTTAPQKFGGEGNTYSPTDLLGAALASCITTVMAIYANRHGADLTGTTVQVEKVLSPTGDIIGLPATVKLPSSLDEKVRQGLETTAKAYPVHASLNPNINAPMTFEYF